MKEQANKEHRRLRKSRWCIRVPQWWREDVNPSTNKQTTEHKNSRFICVIVAALGGAPSRRVPYEPQCERQQEHSNHSPRHMWVLIVVEVVVTPVRPVRALRSPKTSPHRVKCRKQVARNDQTSVNEINSLQQHQLKMTQPMISCIPSSTPPPPARLTPLRHLISYYSKPHMSHQRLSFPKANTFSLSLLLLPSWNFLHFQGVKLWPGHTKTASFPHQMQTRWRHAADRTVQTTAAWFPQG